MDAFSALTHSAVCVQWPSPGCPVGPNAGSRSAAAVAMGGLGLWFGYFVVFSNACHVCQSELYPMRLRATGDGGEHTVQGTRAATGITTA